MSESNRVALRYIPEVTYGTTPVDGVWQALRFEGESLTATPDVVVSNEIRSDRHISDQLQTGLTVGGGFNFELSPNTFDSLIESALCGAWTANVLKVGVVDSSYTLEKEFEDVNKFITFTGMRVGQMSLSLAYGAIATGTFTFAGNGSDTPVASLVGLGSTTAATTTPILNASSDVNSVKIDGVATDICITSMTLDVNNNLRPITCIGSVAPTNQTKGSASVTGAVEMYLDANSFVMYSNVLTQTEVSLEFTITDGTDSYTFFLPKVKLSGDAPMAGSKDSDVLMSFNYTALYDATEDTSLVITRVDA